MMQSSLCSVPSRLKTAQAGWGQIWLGLVGVELVPTMCRSRPWEQHVSVTKPQEDFWERPLTLGPGNRDLLLTSKGLVLSVAIKPQIICVVIICPVIIFPFYPTKVQMPSDCTSLVPRCRGPALWTSQQKFREAEGSNANVILSSFHLKYFCGSLLPSGTMANPFPGFTRPAYLPFVFFCLSGPHTMNLSSSWTLRVSVTSELLQVQFPGQASIKKFSPP